MMLRYLPKAALSRLAGRVARRPESRHLIPWFIRYYRAEVSDTVVPAGGYPSLQAFFCRSLRPGARPVSPPPGLVSPVDGQVGACGQILDGQLLQAKGRRYGLAALLGGDAALAASLQGGLYCTLYLAPGNYHRIHAPVTARLLRSRALPGQFWPVNARAVERVPNLFAENERVVVELVADPVSAGEENTGPQQLVMVLVGACLVGGIRLTVEAEQRVDRGQELGRFEFGSTVIVLVPPGAGIAWAVASGERVRVGQRLGLSPGGAGGGEAHRPAGY